MKFSSASVILVAALSVSAHPSRHAHQEAHRRFVQAREEFVIAKKPVPTTTTAAPPPPPAATSSAAPPPPPPAKPSPSPSPSNSGSNSGSGGFIPFCGGNSKRATAQEIGYKGNVGGGGKYGCNLMAVPQNIADKYQYTMVIENKSGQDQKGVCWNKIGPTGGINGFFAGNEALTITIAAGATQVIAVDTNSQGGCTFGAGSIAKTNFGQWAGTWVEFDFGNLSNGGYSGADASCLVAAANKLPIPALSVCGPGGPCSVIHQGGTGSNAYLAGMEAADGVGLNIGPGKTSITVTIG